MRSRTTWETRLPSDVKLNRTPRSGYAIPSSVPLSSGTLTGRMLSSCSLRASASGDIDCGRLTTRVRTLSSTIVASTCGYEFKANNRTSSPFSCETSLPSPHFSASCLAGVSPGCAPLNVAASTVTAGWGGGSAKEVANGEAAPPAGPPVGSFAASSSTSAANEHRTGFATISAATKNMATNDRG